MTKHRPTADELAGIARVEIDSANPATIVSALLELLQVVSDDKHAAAIALAVFQLTCIATGVLDDVFDGDGDASTTAFNAAMKPIFRESSRIVQATRQLLMKDDHSNSDDCKDYRNAQRRLRSTLATIGDGDDDRDLARDTLRHAIAHLDARHAASHGVKPTREPSAPIALGPTNDRVLTEQERAQLALAVAMADMSKAH